jgi:hypothetical protein
LGQKHGRVGQTPTDGPQAQRRIQAMRLMKEIPEIENKITEGSLNLSNIAQAQTAFNELKRQNDNQPVSRSRKIEVLSNLENLSKIFGYYAFSATNVRRLRALDWSL